MPRIPAPSIRSTWIVALVLSTLVALTLTGQAVGQDAPPPPETLSAASYPLFAIGQDLRLATLQVVEGADGSARIVVSLPGPTPAGATRAVLYHGDCGPDRPIALRLTPFDVDDDPLSSVTEDAAWTYARLTEGDLFAYLFASEDVDLPDSVGLDGDVLACGEVGVGATQ